MSDHKAELLQKFKDLDNDGSGFLNFEEVKTAFHAFIKKFPDSPISFTDEEIEIFFETADDDGDGKISYEEFVNNLEL